MAPAPSLNALKHAKLILDACVAEHELRAHVSTTIESRPYVAHCAMLTVEDFRQVSRFLGEHIDLRELAGETAPTVDESAFQLLRELRASLAPTYRLTPEGQAYMEKIDKVIGAVPKHKPNV